MENERTVSLPLYIIRLNLVNKINSEDATWGKWNCKMKKSCCVWGQVCRSSAGWNKEKEGAYRPLFSLYNLSATLHCCTAIKLVISTQMTCLLPTYLSVLNRQTLISWKLLGKAALARWAFIPLSYGGARMLSGFSCTVAGDLARGTRSGVGLGWPIKCSVGSLLLLLCGPAIFSLVWLLAASATYWD